ncbi:B-cell receptor CD22-like [Pelodytes ibericus]
MRFSKTQNRTAYSRANSTVSIDIWCKLDFYPQGGTRIPRASYPEARCDHQLLDAAGWFSNSTCQEGWSFTFPRSIHVLKRGSVTIPCTFTSPVDYREVNIIWYVYNVIDYPQVFNSEDPSAVLAEYRSRTSLVGDEPNSCSLRIDDVTSNERFYPGISSKINSYNLKDGQTVQVLFTDSSCDDWSFTFPQYIEALKGSCVEIPCSFTNPEGSTDFNLIWFGGKKEILNYRNPSGADSEYKHRTTLVGNGTNSCSLKISNVKRTGEYYPGVNEDINSYKLKGWQKIKVHVIDNLLPPSVNVTGDMEEGRTDSLLCSAYYTCPSSPPTLEWNTAGPPIRVQHEYFGGGYWRIQSEIKYHPSFQDHGKSLRCTAVYSNEQKSIAQVRLNITFSPKNTTIRIRRRTEIKEGEDVPLQCVTLANPPASSYKWYKLGKNSREELNENTDKLIVLKVHWENKRYYCCARNTLGTGESPEIQLSVQYSAKEVHINTGKSTFTKGDTMELECVFWKSNPDPTHYTWYLDGLPLNRGNGNILILRNVTAEQTGNYSCEAHNDVGNSLSESVPIKIISTADGDHGDSQLLILGGVAGVFLIILLVLFIYVFARWKRTKKSSHQNTRTDENTLNRTRLDQIPMDDHLYGNIESEPCYSNTSNQPFTKPHNAANSQTHPTNHEEVLYSEPLTMSENILYTTVDHNQRYRAQEFLSTRQVTETEYVTVKH